MDHVHEGDFQRWAQAHRGRAILDPAWRGFVDAFADRFGVRPLWTEPDADGARESPPWPEMPAVTVVLANSVDYRVLVPQQPPSVRTLQAVTRLLVDQLEPPWTPPDDPRVSLIDFEQQAKWRASDLVTEAERAEFDAALALGDRLWLTRRYLGPPIVFVQTRAQAKQLRASGVSATWADRWFSLASSHDEFGFLTRDDVAIEIDSRERFEAQYGGSWYGYFLK